MKIWMVTVSNRFDGIIEMKFFFEHVNAHLFAHSVYPENTATIKQVEVE